MFGLELPGDDGIAFWARDCAAVGKTDDEVS